MIYTAGWESSHYIVLGWCRFSDVAVAEKGQMSLRFCLWDWPGFTQKPDSIFRNLDWNFFSHPNMKFHYWIYPCSQKNHMLRLFRGLILSHSSCNHFGKVSLIFVSAFFVILSLCDQPLLSSRWPFPLLTWECKPAKCKASSSTLLLFQISGTALYFSSDYEPGQGLHRLSPLDPADKPSPMRKCIHCYKWQCRAW